MYLGLGLTIGNVALMGGVPAWVLTSGGELAALDLDFVNNRAWVAPQGGVSIPSLLNCARASIGYYTDAAGVLTQVPANTLRYGNNGLLVEDTATNYLLYSQTFNNTWQLTNCLAFGSGSVVDATSAPDQTTTADLIVPGTGIGNHLIRQDLNTPAGQMQIGIFVKPAGYTRFGIREGLVTGSYACFDLTGEGAVLATGGTGAAGAITKLAGGWYHALLSFPVGVPGTWGARYYVLDSGYSSGSPHLYNWNGNGSSGLYLWGAQAHIGPASSYIPTGAASVTRSADVVTFANVIWLDGAHDTIYTEHVAKNVNNATILVLDATNDKSIREQTGMSMCIADATVTNTVSAGTTVRTASRLALNDFGIAMYDGQVAADTSEAAPGTLAGARLGADLAGANCLNGHIRRVAAFKGLAADNATLKTLARDGKILDGLSLHMTEAPVTLVLPSPYSPAGMVHPSVVYVRGGWHGYNRWMAITPYPNANDDFENPCILASNDGVTWVVPAGVTNPIVPAPPDVATGGYNSDPHLVLSPDGAKLYLLYRYNSVSAPEERLMLCESADGVTWTTPVMIYGAGIAVRRVAAPSLWHDGTTWVIMGCDILLAGNAFVRMTNSGADPYAGWSDPVAIALAHPDSGSWWHGFFVRQSNGSIVGLIQDGGSGGGSLYQAYSTDNGLTFSAERYVYAKGFYRSCFVNTSTSGDERGEAYLGIIASTEVRRAPAKFNHADIVAELPVFAADTNNTFYDDFERPDAGSLGTAPSGQAYVISAGAFGISTGRAYNTTTGNNRALVDLGTGGEHCRIMWQFAALGTEGWVIFRAADSLNYWRVGPKLDKIVNGSVAIRRSIPALKTGYSEVIADGTSITILVDGEPVWNEPDTYLSSNQTKIGIQAGGGADATYYHFLTADILT